MTTLLSSQSSGKTTVELSSMLSNRNDKVLRKKVPMPSVTLFIEEKFWFLNKEFSMSQQQSVHLFGSEEQVLHISTKIGAKP